MMCAALAYTYDSDDSAGEALIHTLDFYANQFNNTMYGIAFNGFAM